MIDPVRRSIPIAFKIDKLIDNCLSISFHNWIIPLANNSAIASLISMIISFDLNELLTLVLFSHAIKTCQYKK